MTIRHATARYVAAVMLVAATACGPPPSPPDVGAETVPVSDREGNIVGTVRVDDLDRAAEDGTLVEVHDQDGRLVGHLGPEGFIPLGSN